MDQTTPSNRTQGVQPPTPLGDQSPREWKRIQTILEATRDLAGAIAEPHETRISDVLNRLKSLAKALGL